MRKLTVSVRPNLFMRQMIKPIFEKLDSIELCELMRMDFEKGKKIGVAEITVKPGVDITREKFQNRFEVLDILSRKGSKYTCLLKANVPKRGLKLLRFFDFDLIYDIPTIMTRDLLTYSVIGEEKNLKRLLKMLKLIGRVEKTSYKQADYRGIGMAQSLTEKQNRILAEAVKAGYYRYPREIDTAELARRLGVSKTTLVEHLRKAENRIMEKVFV